MHIFANVYMRVIDRHLLRLRPFKASDDHRREVSRALTHQQELHAHRHGALGVRYLCELPPQGPQVPEI